MQPLHAIAMCPNCASAKLDWNPASVTCINCGTEFRREGEFVDFVENGLLNELEVKTLEVWGNDLHAADLAVPAHFVQIQSLFPRPWLCSFKGTVLEIGCGSGTDTLQLSRLNDSISLFAFDIGKNVAGLSRRLSREVNLRIFRASALRIPLKNDTVDMVYSFGVFHHTSDPAKCLEEAYRVLKRSGAVFFYLYSAHEDNPVKFAGILLEKVLMRTLKSVPGILLNPLLYLVSLPCLLLFSWPAALVRLCGSQEVAKKLPMHWGTTPTSILPDLKDRLLAPVNHRFTYKQLRSLLEKTSFHEIQLQKTSAGLFGYCVK